MAASTNQLVNKARKFAAPAVVVGAFVLGAALFVGHGGVHAASSAAALDDQSVSALTALDQAMEAIAARVTPAVVNIAVTSRSTEDETSQNQLQNLPPGFAQFFGQGNPFGGGQQAQPRIQHGIGSGVIISPDGYIVTNNHVVDGATQIRVTLHDRRIFSGKVVGVDKLTDVAVVKIDATGLPAISWGDSTKLEPGQTVLAFGSPFGSLRFSVTRGIVSAINRDNPFRDDARKPGGFIQTDAAINPGNSGGPLVDAHGALIGINTWIITGDGSFAGAGFAIPSQMVKSTADQLIKNGKIEHGYLGLSLNDVTPENAAFFHMDDASGALVAQVSPDSPASRAGLKTGDVVDELNGAKIANSSALQVGVSQLTPGTKVVLGVMRDGKQTTINATVGQYHANTEVASSDSDDNGSGKAANSGKLGLAVSDLNAQTRQQLNVPDSVHGVVIQNVRPGSPADDAALQPGDLILEVNRQPSSSASQFVDEVHKNPAGKDLLLLVWSRGNATYLTLHPDSAEQSGE